MNPAVDCIVIGAGAAGLAAGAALVRAGRRVVILEASTRVGGRIMTRHHDVPLELGAEFIHGLPASTWTLVREARLRTTELTGTPYRYGDGTLQRAGAETQDAFETLATLGRWLSKQAPGTDISFADYLRTAGIVGEQADRASRYVEGFNAADQQRISAAALVRQQAAEDRIEGDRLFHLAAGYDSLPQYLAGVFEEGGGEVRLQQQVRAVEWHRGGLTVTGEANLRLQARHAIIAVPLGVLKSGDVDFRPSIPAVSAALQGLEMGPVLRFSLLFRHAFWEDVAPGMLFLFASEQPFPTWWTAHPGDSPHLTAWIGGPTALRRVQGRSGEAVVDAALGQLSAMFRLPRGAARHELLAAVSHDWQKDPLTRGAYSYAAVGGVDASSRLAEPVAQTLFFAGEHTDTEGHWGTVHAALASGTRAAQQVLSST